jgi:signal transduction histidine kinase
MRALVLERMHPNAAESRYLDRQIAYARPIFLILAVVDLLELKRAGGDDRPFVFLLGYLIFALLVISAEQLLHKRDWHLPLVVDLAALVVFLFISPSEVAIWFPYLFVAFAAGIRWGLRAAILLAGAVSLALVVRVAIHGVVHWPVVISWTALAVGTFAGGVGLAFLGERSRRHSSDNEFLARMASLLQVDQGLAESLRLMLDELARHFDCQEGYLAFLDSELERIFVWKVKVGESERISPENLTLARTDAYMLDDLNATLCWTSLEGAGEGFGWDRRDGRRLTALPRLPGTSRQELHILSFLTASFDHSGQPSGRILLVNCGHKVAPQELRWFETVVRHLGPPLENLFLLRHMRARAIETERSRISRDLHDGILQTLLSVEIQLDVLRRKVVTAPEHAATSIAGLQQTVRNESAELRGLVTDLRPVRVQSADLVDLMRGFAARYRHDAGIALDLLITPDGLQAPDRVCRELFQIYREALNNIKKHARASHVVVKLWQDDSRLILVVDDNGEGFSFAGRFTGDELDRLRLGPISIKEHARAVGAALTVESSPGHGARLTIEVPLG